MRRRWATPCRLLAAHSALVQGMPQSLVRELTCTKGRGVGNLNPGLGAMDTFDEPPG